MAETKILFQNHKFKMSKKIKIMVVEDDFIIATDISESLEEMGFEVCATLESGEEAVNKIGEYHPDIILMDVNLAGNLDGIETVNQINKTNPTPVIFLTANNDHLTFERAKNTEPFAYITKPFDTADLQRAIELAVDKFQKQDEEYQQFNQKKSLLKDRIFIKVKDKLLKIDVSEILWIEADRNYCELVTKEKKYLVSSNLKNLAEKLKHQEAFFRTHRSYIVNLHHIESVSELYLNVHQKQIPIGRSFKEKLFEVLQTI